MRRAHRVIVEVTLDERVTVKKAVNLVREALIRGELSELGATTFRVKEAERVLQAEHRHRNRIREQTRSSSDEGGDGQSRS